MHVKKGPAMAAGNSVCSEDVVVGDSNLCV